MVKKAKKASADNQDIVNGFDVLPRNDYSQLNGVPAIGPSFQPNMIMPSNGTVLQTYSETAVAIPAPNTNQAQMTEETTAAASDPVDLPHDLHAPALDEGQRMPSKQATPDQQIPLDPALMVEPETGGDVLMEDASTSLEVVQPRQEQEMTEAVLEHNTIKDEDGPADDVLRAESAAPVPPSPVHEQQTVPDEEYPPPISPQPTSPLTELSRMSMSPEQPHNEPIPTFESPKPARHSSRQTKPIERYSDTTSTEPRRRSTTSRTPAPAAAAKSTSPQERHTPSKRRQSSAKASQHPRQDSKVEPKPRAQSQSQSQSHVETEEDASLRLARELQGYEFGLRNRSK